MVDRVAVFLDYQNVHLTAHGLFTNPGTPVHKALVHPLHLAERIVSKRKPASELHQVRIFRGRPNPARDPVPTAANDAQTAAWSRDSRVSVTRRDLNYRGWPDHPPREKGVDVAMAIDLVESALLKQYDVAVVFTADTDLVPAIEMAFYRTEPRVEIAAWSGQKPLWFPKELAAGRRLPWCHFLSEEDFKAVQDPTNYVP
ncbi:NYN domain-containing protein [Streptomyces antibioticus]|uniref:NYN domain-containing protein n=1 Tax=Streptomyces antibioticus TaxID=1890 RepID=UPI0037BC6680